MSDLGFVSRRPVHTLMRLQPLVERHMRSWAPAENFTIDRVLGSEVYFAQVLIEPDAVDRQCRAWVDRNRLQFRTEYDRTVKTTVVEGLYSKPISHQAECTLANVPECESEHAV